LIALPGKFQASKKLYRDFDAREIVYARNALKALGFRVNVKGEFGFLGIHVDDGSLTVDIHAVTIFLGGGDLTPGGFKQLV